MYIEINTSLVLPPNVIGNLFLSLLLLMFTFDDITLTLLRNSSLSFHQRVYFIRTKTCVCMLLILGQQQHSLSGKYLTHAWYLFK